jgi:hypothetical protein
VGEYVAPSLHIGRYVVHAEAAGFKSVEQKDVVLQVGDRARVDFQLEVGAATEQVTVEAAPVAVQADSRARGYAAVRGGMAARIMDTLRGAAGTR